MTTSEVETRTVQVHRKTLQSKEENRDLLANLPA